VTIRVDMINRTEPSAAKGACSNELVFRHSALLRNPGQAFSGFAVGFVLVSLAAAQQPPYSNGLSVPGFDAQLLGRFGWLRRNPEVSLLTVNPTTPADTLITTIPLETLS
jgi:hypothetical protein